MIVMKGIKKNGIYSLLGSTTVGSITSVHGYSMNNAMLWHKRLGLVSHKGLTMAKQGLLGDQKLQEMEFSEICVYGKLCRVKYFGTGVQRTKGTLYYIHSDLWGTF